MKKQKEKKEPKYIVIGVTYGNKDFVDCMKAVIKNELAQK